MADLVVTAADVASYDGAETAQDNAGEAITAGQTLYKHTDGKMYKAIDTSAAAAACRGVALCNAAEDQPVVYATRGGVNPGAAVTVGEIYAVTDTAGGVALHSERASGDYITTLGIATTTSRINLNIDRSGVAIE